MARSRDHHHHAALVALVVIGLQQLLCSMSPVPMITSAAAAQFDYSDALMRSLLYFEGQRSGKLPSDQRVSWRGDSALNDSSSAGV
jgi:hypothetical protein